MTDYKQLAKELRIGNYLQGEPISITRLGMYGDGTTAITGHGIDLMERGMITDLEPMPLTDKILEQCGFSKWDGGWSLDAWNNEQEPEAICRIDIDFTDGMIKFKSRYESNPYSRPLPNIKYLHQLQNLYFYITGNELEIDFSK